MPITVKTREINGEREGKERFVGESRHALTEQDGLGRSKCAEAIENDAFEPRHEANAVQFRTILELFVIEICDVELPESPFGCFNAMR